MLDKNWKPVPLKECPDVPAVVETRMLDGSFTSAVWTDESHTNRTVFPCTCVARIGFARILSQTAVAFINCGTLKQKDLNIIIADLGNYRIRELTPEEFSQEGSEVIARVMAQKKEEH